MMCAKATAVHRGQIENVIEQLIDIGQLDGANALIFVLDDLDGDPELEDDGSEEPSLGAVNPTFPSLDAKPAEWALTRGVTQERWSGGARDDREDEHDGRELVDEGGCKETTPSTIASIRARASQRASLVALPVLIAREMNGVVVIVGNGGDGIAGAVPSPARITDNVHGRG
jgi:hypothetical protein